MCLWRNIVCVPRSLIRFNFVCSDERQNETTYQKSEIQIVRNKVHVYVQTGIVTQTLYQLKQKKKSDKMKYNVIIRIQLDGKIDWKHRIQQKLKCFHDKITENSNEILTQYTLPCLLKYH